MNYFLFDEIQERKIEGKRKEGVMNHRFYIQSVVLNCQSFSHIARKKKMTMSYNEETLDGKRKTVTDPLMLI